jgi:hypothetical protein
VLLALTCVAHAQVKVTIDRNTGMKATPQFKFQHVPGPSPDDTASNAKLSLVVGERDGNSADLSALMDNQLPTDPDQPASNFFFTAGTDGGRFRIDLGSVIDIAQVNTYSWHVGSRAPQVYKLFISDGTDPKFNPSPDEHTDPANCGWKVVTTVDTRPERGDFGGQYGVNITDASGTLGKIRYLLFDSVPTEAEDVGPSRRTSTRRWSRTVQLKSCSLRASCESEPLKPGKHNIRYEFEKTGKEPAGAGRIGRLFVDGKKMAEQKIPRTSAFGYSLDETFDVGCDKMSPVRDEYKPQAEFTGKIIKIDFDLKPDLTQEKEAKDQAQLKAAMIKQ